MILSKVSKGIPKSVYQIRYKNEICSSFCGRFESRRYMSMSSDADGNSDRQGSIVQPWTYKDCVRLIFLRTNRLPLSDKANSFIKDLIPIPESTYAFSSFRFRDSSFLMSFTGGDLAINDTDLDSRTVRWQGISDILDRGTISCISQFNRIQTRSHRRNTNIMYDFVSKIYDKPEKKKIEKPPKFHRWSVEEISKLKEAVTQYKLSATSEKEQINGGSIAWKKIAESVGTRNAFQCWIKWNRSISPNIIRGPFNEEEIRCLVNGFQRYPNQWSRLIQEFDELRGRTPEQCRLFFERNSANSGKQFDYINSDRV